MFGSVIEGMDIVRTIEGVGSSTGRTSQTVTIVDCLVASLRFKALRVKYLLSNEYTIKLPKAVKVINKHYAHDSESRATNKMSADCRHTVHPIKGAKVRLQLDSNPPRKI